MHTRDIGALTARAPESKLNGGAGRNEIFSDPERGLRTGRTYELDPLSIDESGTRMQGDLGIDTVEVY